MAQPYEIDSFKRTFVLFLLLVVFPSAGVSGFGVLAIKNERAAVEKHLEQLYGGSLRTLEEGVAQDLDDAVQSVPAVFGKGRDADAIRELRARNPLYGPVLVVEEDGEVSFRETDDPTFAAAEPELLARLTGLGPRAAGHVRIDSGPGRGLYAIKRMDDGSTVIYRVELEGLERLFPEMARKRFPDATATFTLSRVEPPAELGPANSGLSRLLAEVTQARDVALSGAPNAVAVRRLQSPLSQYEIAALMPSEDDATALSRRNRILYIVLLVIFYGTMTTGVVLTARAIYREAKLSRLKTDFVSAISHELRTPLTSIRMFVETLAMGRARDDQEVKECLNLLARETERLSAMIDRVLDWARIESGRKIYRRHSVTANEIVDGAVAAFRTQLLAAGQADDDKMKLLVALPETLPTVTADPEAMSGVLLNLLQNAYKYTGAEKRIEVSARTAGTQLEIEVQDNGPGIAKADRKRIFERFYRADDLLTRKTEGTGLGLAIAMRIVQAHGGKLLVRSEKGQGSRFVVSLPTERAA